jgi:pyrroline-5-carboxylate reductase
MNVVFLGGGRITSAMVAGLRLAKTRHRLLVHDRNPGKLRHLRKAYEIIVEPDLKRAVTQADLLLIAVRPDSVAELLRNIGPVSQPLLAVSLVAGVPLRALSGGVGIPVRWARAMPSPVCRSGRGLTALTFPRAAAQRLGKRDRKLVVDFFASLGPVVEIPESKFDAFTVTYSCSHGYHALAVLAKCAQDAGLDRKTALLASAHALADGVIAWREGRHSLESLLEEAVTPGGIAASAANGMDKAGYRQAVRKGVLAGLRRARE